MPLKVVNIVLRKYCAILIALAICLLLLASCTTPPSQSTPTPRLDIASIPLAQALSSGKPTLAEFGRGTCIPCKAMKPILDDLSIEYQGRLNVVIVSVDEYRDLTNYYRIMAIPTQIGFDSGGKEVFRHVGFWPKDQIIAHLSKLGIN